MTNESRPDAPEAKGTGHFIQTIIDRDLASGRYERVMTRFPPEPNGYLHIGHAKAIWLNFSLAEHFGGVCNLRFDDTNPAAENVEYVDAIQASIRWLGYDWGDRLYFASDYFEQLYAFAVELVRAGKAYVCDLSLEDVRAYRGLWTEPGRESPYRNRTVDENLDLFTRMRAGEFPDGARTLRARIDMAAGNTNLRDPVMYRISRTPHHRTGTAWCIYPTYDWAHGQSDSIEGITHSICTLEFEDHRPLYDWFLEALGIHHPRQVEFARLNLAFTVMSKRKLIALVRDGHVSGWDDPRMPTLVGMRRRGVPAAAVRALCERTGVAKQNGLVDPALLDFCIREELNRTANRVMTVLRPLKVVIENVPEGHVEHLPAVNNPEDPSAGTRTVPFSRTLYIEADDFMEDPPKKFFRLAPGREVRLRYGYFLTCTDVVRGADGSISELRCTIDLATKGGNAPDGRKVKGTIHWVSAEHAVDVRVRLFDRLFTDPEPGADYLDALNPESLVVLDACKAEPGLKNASPGTSVQFERLGYFVVDEESAPGAPVFNRTVTLRDTWARIQQRDGGGR